METNSLKTTSILNVNVAIVGADEKLILTLIEYWLSLGPNDLASQNIFSKIFWANEEPVQINLYYFRSHHELQIDIIWHAIVFLMDTITETIDVDSNSSFYCMLELKDINETNEIDIYDKYIDSTNKMTHYVCSIKSNHLVKYLDEITTEAYHYSKMMALRVTPILNNYSNVFSYKMDYFENIFYVPTESQSCCTIF